MLKKTFIILGILFSLLLVLIVALPLVVDVDKYRPEIEKVANDQIQGRLSLGKLKLSLWGQIKVEIDSIELLDKDKHKIFAAKESFIHLPFFSILSGSPLITFKAKNPEVYVLKNKVGKLNVLSLMNESAMPISKADSGVAPMDSKSKVSSTQSTALPSIATRARIGIEIQNANLLYKDLMTDLTSKIENLDIKIKDLSLERTTHAEITANIDTAMAKTISVKGPVVAKATLKPTTIGGIFQKAEVDFETDFTKLVIILPDLFEKKSGVLAKFSSNLIYSSEKIQIISAVTQFFNLEVDVKGSLDGLNGSAPSMNVQFNSNEMLLKPWVELLPSLKDYELGGNVKLNGNLGGTFTVPTYGANLSFNSLTAKAPHLKKQPQIDGKIKVSTDRIDEMSLVFKAPSNDLKINGKLNSFSKPNLDIAVTSTGMDLDELIDFPKTNIKEPATVPLKSVENTTKSAEPSLKEASGKEVKEEDLDKMLNPLRENPVMKAFVVSATVQMKYLKAYGAKMTDIDGKMSMNNLALNVSAFKFNLWNGKLSSSATVQMLPSTPSYRFNAEVANLELQQAVSSQFALFKNTLLGNANFKIEGTGSSFNSKVLKKNLNARGSMKVDDATFATIDIVKMVGEGLNKTLGVIASKVPGMKDQKLSLPANTESKYSVVTSDFTINDGKFMAPNFNGKALPNKGIDIKGETTMGLIDYALKANWELVDTYNLTHARDISVDQAGMKIEHILADGSNPVKFPIQVTGTAFAPQFSYTALVESLGKVALSNVGKALGNKAKDEAKKQIEQQLKTNAPKELKNVLKGLGF